MSETQALKALRKSLRRPLALVEMFEAGTLRPKRGDRRPRGQPSWRENELLRASVIVSIGALDAYLSDVGAEVLISQLQRASSLSEDARSVLRRVIKEIDTLPIELALTANSSDRQEIARKAILEHLSNRVSNHGTKGVSSTVARMGEAMIWTELDQLVPDDLVPASMKSGTATATLDAWTSKRHELVHRGRAIKVKGAQARALLEFVEAIADAVDVHARSALADSV